ncbi:unnamed protein product [Paramecium octaurelia]|uniref:Transmembrane protein n=1 Tax=Paramecium octaurelia TaxID=43137 RepID=A0A8S1WIC4_PAROT|nr:unnamed protein product [Paramecium octaurelia]
MDSVSAGIAKLDIFGQLVFLRINRQANYKTIFGGCASIAVMSVMILIFITNFISFIQKEQLKVVSISEYEDVIDNISFQDSQFLFAIKIEQLNFIQRPYFNITMKQKLYFRNTEGDVKKETIDIQLVPCTLDRYTQIFSEYNINFTQQFQQLHLSDFLCPSINTNILIGGTYSSNQFDFIELSIIQCQNNSQNLWNPICDNPIDTSYKVRLYTVNQNINPYKPKDSYIQPFLDDSLSFTINLNSTKFANIYFTKYEFQNDESLLPISMIEERTFFVLDSSDIQQDTTEIDENSLAKLQLRKKPFKTRFLRQYQKLDELLSNIGGILQIMTFFIGLLVTIYNRVNYMVELSNRIYDFSVDDSYQKKIYSDNLQILTEQQKNERLGLDSKIQTSNQRIMTENDQCDNCIESYKEEQKNFQKEGLSFRLNFTTGLDYFSNQLQKMFEKKKPISLDFQIFLNYITCNFLFKEVPKVKLMNKAQQDIHLQISEQIISQSDIYSILSRLNEIDKLKEVMLTPKQLVMFNFTPKKLITLEDEDLKIDRNMVESQNKSSKDKQIEFLIYAKMMLKMKRQNKNEKNTRSIRSNKRASFLPQPLDNYVYQQIYSAYDEIFKNKNQQETLNSQLISMLGPEMEMIYKVGKIIDQNVRPMTKSHKKLISSDNQQKGLIREEDDFKDE